MKVTRNKKGILLECLMIFAKYSDEQNPISTKELMKHLKDDFGHQATRQVLAEDMKILESLGFKIGNNRRRYYLVRPIHPEEIEAICHSVVASNVIPRSYSEELIERLKNLQSIHFGDDRDLYLHTVNVDKQEDREVYDNISQISKAISEKRIISFDHYHYDNDRRLVKYRNKRYHTVPCRTVAKDGHFFLLAYDHKNDTYVHYRIDKIKDIKLEGKHDFEVDIDPYEYTRHRLYMLTGDIIDCTLRIGGEVIDEVFELFGKDTRIVQTNEKNTYFAYVKAPAQSLIHFACQYVEHVEVASPFEVREAVKEVFNEAFKKYI